MCDIAVVLYSCSCHYMIFAITTFDDDHNVYCKWQEFKVDENNNTYFTSVTVVIFLYVYIILNFLVC